MFLQEKTDIGILNLITDCFPALALGLERAEPDVMERPPRPASDGIFSGGLGFDVAYQGVLITVITLASYIVGHCMEVGYFEMPHGVSPHGMTMAFLTMSMCEIFHSFNMRSQRRSVFTLPGHNKVLWAAMIGSLILTTVVLEVPAVANAFGFTPVGWTEYGIALALAVLVIPVVELIEHARVLVAAQVLHADGADQLECVGRSVHLNAYGVDVEHLVAHGLDLCLGTAGADDLLRDAVLAALRLVPDGIAVLTFFHDRAV